MHAVILTKLGGEVSATSSHWNGNNTDETLLKLRGFTSKWCIALKQIENCFNAMRWSRVYATRNPAGRLTYPRLPCRIQFADSK